MIVSQLPASSTSTKLIRLLLADSQRETISVSQDSCAFGKRTVFLPQQPQYPIAHETGAADSGMASSRPARCTTDSTLATTAWRRRIVVICRPVMRISRGVRADIALILITIIWGCMFTLVKKSLAQVSPITLIALRFGVATAAIVLCMPGSFLHISRETLRRGTILSAFLLGGFVFQTLGLRTTSPARSAFITSLSVLLVPVLGYLVFRHRPRAQTLAGVAIATVGLGLLTLERMELSLNRGDTLTLICALVFAFHILFVGRYVTDGDYRQLVALQIAGSALLCTVMLPLVETPFLVWDPALGVYIFILGVLATAVAYYGQSWAQRFTTPNRTALIFSLEPFFAAIFAYALLDQGLSTREWVGGILVIAGIVTSEFHRA